MADTSTNNKRIAKNTLLLYFRMLLTMVVSLYTSRVVLNTLGVEDFGIYNVVGGVVAMFSVISGSLSSAISRFITYELGKGNRQRLKVIFSSAIIIQIALALLIGILAEIGGVWFLNAKMNIPSDRLEAANWVLQCSIITFMVNLISIPYNAAIIAHERMKAFAYVSILEVTLKLLVVFTLYIALFDKLKTYAMLLVTVAVIIRFVYGYYCKRHFEECTYRFVFNRKVLKEMTNFAGWNFIGSSSAVLRDQGVNIALNLFCGPPVNAARGIAFQVSTAINSFVVNFMTALNPQITKSYATGDHNYMMLLIFQGARFAFYLLLILSLPVILNTHYILALWLKLVPEHTVRFVQLILIFALSESISQPLITAQLATGNIRNYQIVVGGLQMLNLPISYILLRFGYPPEMTIVVAICISQCCLSARLYMLQRMIGLKVRIYLKSVYFNVLMVSIGATVVPLIAVQCLLESFVSFLLLCSITVISTLVSIFYIGCNQKERQMVKRKMFQTYRKIDFIIR